MSEPPLNLKFISISVGSKESINHMILHDLGVSDSKFPDLYLLLIFRYALDSLGHEITFHDLIYCDGIIS